MTVELFWKIYYVRDNMKGLIGCCGARKESTNAEKEVYFQDKFVVPNGNFGWDADGERIVNLFIFWKCDTNV